VEPQNLLIIDDDQSILEMLALLFRMNGHQVTCAEYADEISWYSDWQWQDFDCIITGINQPGMNGLLFTVLVRANNGPPVIVMTGYKPTTARALAFKAGAASFLQKPIDLRKLLKIVDVCCE
jgi:DNA-binding response OmpR family regulator